MKKFDVVVIGAGPSGSAAAMLLSKKGFNVALIEKKAFPREVLCGEFISHEAASFLSDNNLFNEFLSLKPNEINSFALFNEDDDPVTSSLGFQGYGLRRSKFDNLLLKTAARNGTCTYQPAEITKITDNNPGYLVTLNTIDGDVTEIFCWVVLCAYGRQNILDKKLNRPFYNTKSGLNGLKFHIPINKTENLNPHEIQIYTANNVYCGINKVDDNTVTLCFLERKDGSLSSKERLLSLYKSNSYFRKVLPDSESIINEVPLYGTGNIYFGKRKLVSDGIFFIGDSAGVIAPLAGDGISMALESAQISVSVMEKLLNKEINLDTASVLYKKEYISRFNIKLKTASFAQNMLLNNLLRRVGVALINNIPSVLSSIIKYTRSR